MKLALASSPLICIGWVYLKELCTSSASWCSAGCAVMPHSVWSTFVVQLQMSHHGNAFVPPADDSSTYHTTSPVYLCSRRFSGWSVGVKLAARLLLREVVTKDTFRQHLKTFFCLLRTDAYNAWVARLCSGQVGGLAAWGRGFKSRSRHCRFFEVGNRTMAGKLSWDVTTA